MAEWSRESRPDLAAMIGPLWRAAIASERQVLAQTDMPMWGYAVLHELSAGPVRSQVALGTLLGIDQTRLIPILDDLQARDLIDRSPAPDDRRVHLLSITPGGRRLFARLQRRIQAAEEEVVGTLTPAARDALETGLAAFYVSHRNGPNP